LFSLKLCVGQFLLVLSEQLGGGSTAELKLDELFVPLFDFLDVLLVSNPHLVEVDELQVVTHLFFLLDLSFGFEDRHFKGHIFLS